MKILIFGDTHIGRKNFKIDERDNDFKSAFSQVIDRAIEEKVDLIIHTGDLFDAGRPEIKEIIFVIEQLKRVKEKKIPFLAIAGSHDIGTKNTFLNILDRVGLLINLTNPRYYSNLDGRIELNGEEVGEVYVCGIPGRKGEIEEILRAIKVEPMRDRFNIFVFHHIIDDINSMFSDFKKSLLPKGFDLYISGHWHERFETEVYGKKLLYPGSTERCDFREMHSKSKGFYLFDTESKRYRFVELKIREAIIKEITIKEKSPSEIVNLLRDEVREEGKGRMLFFVLKGKVKGGLKSEIDREAIYELAKEKGYLFCKIYTGSLENPDEEFVDVKGRSIAEIEKEFLKNKGFDEKEIKIGQYIINLLGSKKGVDTKQVIKKLEEEL